MERGKEGDKLERTERQRDVKAEEEEEEEGAESKDKDEISHHRFLASLNRLNPTNPLRIIVNGAGGSRFTTPPPPNLAQPLRSSLRQQPPPPRPQTPPPPILVPEEPQPQTPPPPGQHQTRSIFTPTPQVISFPFWHFSRKDFIFFPGINPYLVGSKDLEVTDRFLGLKFELFIEYYGASCLKLVRISKLVS